MKLYRKRKPSFLQRLFRFTVTILILGIIADVFFPSHFESFKRVAKDNFIMAKEKVEIKLKEREEKKALEKEREELEKAQKLEKIESSKLVENSQEEKNTKETISQKYESSYENIVYKTENEKTLKLNIYRPENGDNIPVIFYISGEDWSLDFNSKSAYLDKLKELSKEKIALITLEYRDVNNGIFPNQIDDIKEAIKFISENNEIYGIDSGRIGLIGNNTGGMIAQILGATRDSNLLTTNIKMVITQGAPTDMITLSQDSDGVYISKEDAENKFDKPRTPYGKIVGFHTEHWMGMSGVRKMLKKESELKTNPYWKYVELAKSVSSYEAVNEKSSPMYIIHNINDKKIPVNQSVKFINKLNSLGVENQFVSKESSTDTYDDTQTIEASIKWGLEKLNVK